MSRLPFKATLAARVVVAASLAGDWLDLTRFGLRRQLLVTLKIYSAERDTGNETYDVYVITGDAAKSWDICHFAQIATTGAKTYVARILADTRPAVVSAVPGEAADSILKVDTASADEGIKTLGAGEVRHGPLGQNLRAELVVAGTVVTGIDYELTIEGV